MARFQLHYGRIISLNKSVNKEKLAGILVFIALMGLSSCVTQPPAQTTEQAQLILTKAQIKNDQETNNVKIEILLQPRKAIRMEITATLGISVATVVMTPKQ